MEEIIRKNGFYEEASKLALSACILALKASNEAVEALSRMRNAEHPLELMLAYERLNCAARIIAEDGEDGRKAAHGMKEEALKIMHAKYPKREIHDAMEHSRYMRETSVRMPITECIWQWRMSGIPENAAFEFLSDLSDYEYSRV